jgi:hypothetical protein
MRLETPVIYFHLPSGAASPLTASIKVAFRGGWLTQFYPAAETAGFAPKDTLTEATTGTLTWNDLKIGVGAKGPETSERVWTAPRDVQAASVTTPSGESEQFLFYRGVGHLACPVQVRRTADGRPRARRGAFIELPTDDCATPLAGILSNWGRLRISLTAAGEFGWSDCQPEPSRPVLCPRLLLPQ